jgi:hypothetical protein
MFYCYGDINGLWLELKSREIVWAWNARFLIVLKKGLVGIEQYISLLLMGRIYRGIRLR